MRLSLALLLMQLVTHTTLLAQPRLDKTGWTCVFSDDFDTPPLTRTSNDWSPEFANENFLDGQTFLSTNVVHSTQGGQSQVLLKCRPQPTLSIGTHRDGSTRTNAFNSGLLRSTYDDFLHGGGVYSTIPNSYPDATPGGWLYGMFEITCKLPKHFGATPALWMCGNNTWPPELDILETGRTYENDPADPVNSPGNFKQVMSSTHWGSQANPQICWSKMEFPQVLTDEFHTWTIVWTPYEVAYFMDGVEMKTIKGRLQVPGHADDLYDDPNSTLDNRMMDLIISNATNAPRLIQNNGVWQLYHDLGITDLSDLIVDKVEVYRPDGLSVPTTQYPYHEPRPFDVSSDAAFETFARYTILPIYASATFRSENGWTQEYVGLDLVEFPLGASNFTTDYKIVGKPVVTKGGDEGFFFVDAQSGNNILSYGQKFPTIANPDRYLVVVIDETPLVDLEIAGHRAKSVPYLKHNPGALTVYYRRGGSLWTATSFDDGKTWDKREVTEAAEWPIGGEMSCDLDKTDEVVIYRSSNNELIELKRRIFSYGTFGSVENLTMYAQDASNPNNGAPQDVGSYLTFDPVESNIYYYKTLDGLGIGVLFFGVNGWTYQHISVKGGVDMLKPTVKWDDTWRRILYTNGTSGMLRALDPTTLTQQDILELTGSPAQQPLRYIRDFVAGYSHLPNQQNAAPKNIYFSDWADNKLYMLYWDGGLNGYVREEIRILGEGFSEYTFGNMQPTQQDLPTFYRTTDGRLRKLYYGPQAPIDHLMCNACWVNQADCPWWYTPHVFPLQGNPTDETNKEPETQQERD